MAEILPSLFFLNGKLYRKLKIIKTEDIVVAFCYVDEERTMLLYSQVRRNFQKAFTILEVAKMLHVPSGKIRGFMRRKLVEKPNGFTYHIATRRPLALYWSQDDVLALRDRFYELEPKDKDGLPVKSNLTLASRAELLSVMNGEGAYYVRNSEGGYTKVWRAV